MSLIFLNFIQYLYDVLSCTSCPSVTKQVYGMPLSPQNWLETHSWAGWVIVAVVVIAVSLIVRKLRE